MKRIHTLLKRFGSLSPPQRLVKSELRRAVKEVCGVELGEDAITLSNQVAYLSGPSVIKSEVLLHKKDVLAKLNSVLPGKHRVVNIV